MSEVTVIDLNADMGESREALIAGRDAELMRHISSVNIACGGHSGDEETVRETLMLAKSMGVAAGAHPSYPDRENFGRVEMKIGLDVLERSLLEQMRWFVRMAEKAEVRIGYIKPHGALYHAMTRRREVAGVIANVIRANSTNMAVVAQAGSAALEWFQKMGLAAVGEAFADRAYESDGSLRDRKLAGALLQSPERAAEQALEIVIRGRVKTFGGGTLSVKAETLCVHSDTPGAASIAAHIRESLSAAGIHIRPFTV